MIHFSGVSASSRWLGTQKVPSGLAVTWWCSGAFTRHSTFEQASSLTAAKWL
ncbi:hypothetical protein [Sphingomicrobium astaxanthinifaciens]|uniref:hypothetical protein n=1 Tax=Sphingomicrobium astaxanthinifaciens TaxID=1227949 RepID=UPI001FCBF0D7|nr:hypothetical protein [Sphingomicrobium astaxanthinifaciens]MCJ7421779.1 hypothetical protein [Sphingomicrobium astaxanthinifaciens]